MPSQEVRLRLFVTGRKASKYAGPAETKLACVDGLAEMSGVQSSISSNEDKEDKLAMNSREPNLDFVVDTEPTPVNPHDNGLSNEAKKKGGTKADQNKVGRG